MGLTQNPSAEHMTASSEVLDAVLGKFAQDHLEFDIAADVNAAVAHVRAPFSFIRTEGFKALCKILLKTSNLQPHRQALAASMRRQLPSVLGLVVTALQSAHAPGFFLSAEADGKAVTVPEQLAALDALQGLLLLLPMARSLASELDLCQVIVSKLTQWPDEGLYAGLDALLVLLASERTSREAFLQCQGIDQVCALIVNKDLDDLVRGKAAEFVNILLTHILVASTSGDEGTASGPLSPASASLRQAVGQQLGDKVADMLAQAVDLRDHERGMEMLHEVTAAAVAMVA